MLFVLRPRPCTLSDFLVSRSKHTQRCVLHTQRGYPINTEPAADERCRLTLYRCFLREGAADKHTHTSLISSRLVSTFRETLNEVSDDPAADNLTITVTAC